MSNTLEIAAVDALIDWDAVVQSVSRDRKCKCCGKALGTAHTKRTTCSHACRQRLYDIRRKARLAAQQPVQ